MLTKITQHARQNSFDIIETGFISGKKHFQCYKPFWIPIQLQLIWLEPLWFQPILFGSKPLNFLDVMVLSSYFLFVISWKKPYNNIIHQNNVIVGLTSILHTLKAKNKSWKFSEMFYDINHLQCFYKSAVRFTVVWMS